MVQIRPANHGLHSKTFLKLLYYLHDNIQTLGKILAAYLLQDEETSYPGRKQALQFCITEAAEGTTQEEFSF